MKTLNVNVVPEIVSKNTQLISKVGGLAGTQVFKVETRMAWQGGQEGFEKDKRAVETGEKKGFILNRSPRRLLAKTVLMFVSPSILTRTIPPTCCCLSTTRLLRL